MTEQKSPVVVAVCISHKKGDQKISIDSAKLIENHGIEGDAHAGDWHRQVSLLADESVDRMRGKGFELKPGDFAENILTRGIEVWKIPVGTHVLIGDEAELEITQIGKKCHLDCAVREKIGDCVMPREGIFARVIKGGPIKSGDAIRLM